MEKNSFIPLKCLQQHSVINVIQICSPKQLELQLGKLIKLQLGLELFIHV